MLPAVILSFGYVVLRQVLQLVIVNLIGATTNRTGLAVHAELDTHHYPKGIKITDQQIDALRITHHKFHGEWNYTLRPEHRRTTDTL